MKIIKNTIIIICVSSILLMGCSNKSNNEYKTTDSKSLEYHIPYIDSSSGEKSTSR